MCGILGVVAKTPLTSCLSDGIAGCCSTGPGRGRDRHGGTRDVPHAQGAGMVRDVFPREHALAFRGTGNQRTAAIPRGLGVHAGRSQPFYVNSPFGMSSDTTQSDQFGRPSSRMFRRTCATSTPTRSRCCSTFSAHELELAAKGQNARPGHFFTAVANVQSGVAAAPMPCGHDRGLRAARLPRPVRIRPLVFGRITPTRAPNNLVASESVALTPSASSWCATSSRRSHFHRPKANLPQPPMRGQAGACALHLRIRLPCPPRLGLSTVSVYESRLHMGRHLARRSSARCPAWERCRDPGSGTKPASALGWPTA